MERPSGMTITTLKVMGDLAITKDQYRDPVPRCRPVSAESRNEAASTLECFEDLNLDRPAWMACGNCVGLDPNLFFPERGADTREARAVCEGCEVLDECLEFGMNIKWGIWGGKSERERRKLRKEWKARRAAS